MRRLSRLSVIIAGVVGAALFAPPSPTSAVPDAAKKGDPPPRHVLYRDYDSAADFSTGSFDGTVATQDGLRISTPVGQRDYTDPFGDGSAKTYDYGTWTSPVVAPGFDYSELIASWNASTPGDSWIEVNVRGTADTGATSKWYVLGRWTAGDAHLHRTSVSGQRDELATVLVDTLATVDDHVFSDWQLRVDLYRLAGTSDTPSVRGVGAMASSLPDVKKIPASPTTMTEDVALDLQESSQEP